MVKLISDEKKIEIVQLFEEGFSRTEIAQETDVSHPIIRAVLKEAGYDSQTHKAWKPVDEAAKAQIIELRNLGFSYNQIAQQVGRAKRTVMNVIKDDLLSVRGRGEAVSPERFIAAWQEHDRIADVAQVLTMSMSAVITRAHDYRSKGIPLKRYPTQKEYNWEDLKRFAELFTPPSDEES